MTSMKSNNNRLQYKFSKVFVIPLVIGIFLSIILTLIVLTMYASKLNKDEKIKNLLEKVDLKKSIPKLLSVRNLLNNKFQPIIYNLMKIKEYYNFQNNTKFDNKFDSWINKYMINVDHITNMQNENDTVLLDYSYWHISPSINNFSNLNEITKNQLRLLWKIIPALRSIYEVSKDLDYYRYINIFIASNITDLILYYPLTSMSYKEFEKKNQTNKKNCRNSKYQVMNYYYFPCTRWWKNSINNNENFTITTKNNLNNEYSSTICLKFDLGLMCVKANTTDLIMIFDHFNKELNGYFFVLQTEMSVPFYYTNFPKFNFSSDLIRYEFDRNLTFYIEEILNFPNVLANFTKKNTFNCGILNKTNTSNYQTNCKFETVKFLRNNTYYNYLKILVYFETENYTTSHFMSIIFITNPETFLPTFTKVHDLLLPRLYIQLILFIILGAILLLIAWYLIYFIATNIVKPIKNLKNIIQGINNKKLVMDFEYQEIMKRKFLNEDNYKENDDDEFLEIRSAEIDDLFNILLKLKRVLSFTSNPFVSNDKSTLMNYVMAKYTFEEVQNLKGKNLCNSNVGNLAIKCHKYDKAIFHLLESLNEANFTEKRKTEMMSKSTLKKTRTSLSFVKSKMFTKTDLKKILNSEEKALHMKDANKSMILEKRFPKLLYSYKKFFISLKKLMKSTNFYDEVANQDIFVLKEKHSLKNYEQVLRDYIEHSKKLNDTKRIAEALLEYNEFLIKYHLKPIEKEIELSEEIKLMKQKCFNSVLNNFQLFGAIYENLKDSKSSEDIKNFVEHMQNSKRDSIDLIEIPIMILNQKSIYLKGKLAYYCEDYSLALQNLYKSKEIQLISDASIVVKSIKLIKKIMILIKTENEKEILNLGKKLNKIEMNFKKGLKIRNPTKIKDDILRIVKHINYLDKEVDKYTYSYRDILVLIDISKSMMSDNKKIEKATENTIKIFENYVTSNDRFGVFFYGNSTNSIINLSYKNIHTYSYMKELLENMKKQMQEYKDNEMSDIIKSIMKMYDYLQKKSFRKREKWILIFTDNFSTDQNEEKLNEISNFFKSNDSLFSIILIAINFEKKIEKDKANLFLNFNNSRVIEFDDISYLRDILKMMGVIRNDLVFPNEIYDADRWKN